MPTLNWERQLYQQGCQVIAGVDEAGRGPLAGPVVAAAVVLRPDLTGAEPWLTLIDDSKKLSPAQREQAIELVRENALAIGVAWEEPSEIDRLGILPATIRAMLQAVEGLAHSPQHLLFDYIPLKKCSRPFNAIVKGDSQSYSIAAASIVAKVTRDQIMEQMETRYPGYSFARHKGYPTALHLNLLRQLGPAPIHRRSYAPVRAICQSQGIR